MSRNEERSRSGGEESNKPHGGTRQRTVRPENHSRIITG